MSDTPTVDIEVIGFRQWVVSDDLELASVHKSGAWVPGWNVAVCHRRAVPDHECPGRHDQCQCGLYALHRPNAFWYRSRRDVISGVVAARGRIEVHASGFRAQEARVVALSAGATKRDAAIARAVASEYAVPTVPADMLEEVSSEYGQRVPQSLLPRPEEFFIDEIHRWSDAALAQQIQALNPAFRRMRHEIDSFLRVGLAGLTVAEARATPDPKRRAMGREIPQLPRRGPTYDPRDFAPKRRGGNR